MPGQEDRAYWVGLAGRLSERPLTALAAGRLRREMPVETGPGAASRAEFAHLEALGRLLLGLAPWLELEAELPAPERALRDRFRALALEGLAQAVDPASPDFMNFERDKQPLVDAALLGSALLRAPTALLRKIQGPARARLVQALQSCARISPWPNNWLLFAAMVQVTLAHLGAPWDEGAIEHALSEHERWYLGDGAYSDGEHHAFDYYNSFVIHPLMLEVLEGIRPFSRRWEGRHETALKRARRYAEVQERLISPEGAFPPLGRSLTYRCGVFHHLAFMAWRRELPEPLRPSQVRCALSAVLRRQMEVPGTFDAQGWLTLGFAGHQPGIAEYYVCTGSAYFAATVLLPLGLPPTDAFWAVPDEPWTSKKLWEGGDLGPDKALEAR